MSITGKLDSNLKLTSFPGEIPTSYLYTCGIAGEDFFRKLMEEGKFLASRCPECDTVYFPSRIFCERCMAHIPDVFEVSGKGEVYSFTLCCRNTDGTPMDEPVLIAAIQVDDTDSIVVHYLGKVEPEEAEIGMVVEPVLKPKKDRTGSILDILYFKPSK